MDARTLTSPVFIIYIVSISVLLSGCGFQPMYGHNSPSGSIPANKEDKALPAIQVSNIPERNGQILRNILLDRLYKNGQENAPALRLEVKDLKEVIRDLDITVRSDATREQMTISAVMELYDIQSGHLIERKRVRAKGSYNILSNEYNTRTSQKDLRESLLKRIADRIERSAMIAIIQAEALANQDELSFSEPPAAPAEK